MYFLKDGGRAAVVCLPDGVFNPYTGIRHEPRALGLRDL